MAVRGVWRLEAATASDIISASILGGRGGGGARVFS